YKIPSTGNFDSKFSSGSCEFKSNYDISFGGYVDDRLNANLTQRLLKIDEEGILECYYNRPGKQTWVGEYTGKYLHAASRVWQSTKNEQLKKQMDRIVDVLIACQNEDGYLGTYLPQNYWTDWDVWAHKYNILGLLSYYAVTGHKPALETSIKMGDLLCKTFGESAGQRSIIESSGHVGMASTSVLEPMTYLYRYTGEKKYLDFCKYIIKAYEFANGPKIISTLNSIGKVDKTANAKAYEMTSNLTGIVKLYQLTGDKTLLKAADNAWKDISTYKLYITGTASEHELYRADFDLPAENDSRMGEGCVTTTWMQFSQALYNLTGEAKYINEIENTIYNHLFAAENPQSGCVSYYTALQGVKPYRCTIDGHCCLASVPRGIAAIPELAFTKDVNNGVAINLYTAGKFNSKIKGKDGKEITVDCALETAFPANGIITIKLNPVTKTACRVALRVPVWCSNFKATVNGKILKGIPGTYLNIDETWNKNSIIKVSFDLKTVRLDGDISYPNSTAFKTGPQVLAIDKTLNPLLVNLDDVRMGSAALPVVSKTLLPKGWIGSQVFKTKATYNGKPIDLILVPFADAGQTDGEVRVLIKK
ncbi:MAG: glycoside hydrolase family 127 protein, partial [Ferruginibacter sp.]|nr:glycoside hydrolase family 127 protein [Ferruginibacter sp.]